MTYICSTSDGVLEFLILPLKVALLPSKFLELWGKFVSLFGHFNKLIFGCPAGQQVVQEHISDFGGEAQQCSSI